MLEPNTILQDRYRIIKQIGQGGMGAVYEAIDQRVKCTVVLKRTLFDHAELVQAFEREARLLANLRHPALPRVSDHFVEGNEQYLVMEHIPGQDLAQMLKAIGRPFAPNEVLRWTDELLRVLEYLHRHTPPILHRDIKPANLKLTESGEVYLLDFGLARGAAGQMSTVGYIVKSIPGYTPSYAPIEQVLRSDSQHPERHWVDILSQINSEEVERILQTPTDERSDLYSLGATLYHLLTNETPTHVGRRALYIWRNQPDPVRLVSELNPLVPEEVATIIESSMELNPERRPSSAAAMRMALRDAGQSLRLHTGQLSLHQASPQLLESILRETIKQARSVFAAEFNVLNAKLEIESQVLDEVRLRLQALEGHQLEDVTIKKELNELRAHLINIQANLEETRLTWPIDRRSAEQTAERISREIAWEVTPELAEVLIKQWIEDNASKLRTLAQLTSVRQENEGQTLPHPPVKHYQPLKQNDYPVEVSEDEKSLHNTAIRFANLLATEIKFYNEAAVEEGREANDLYDRLRDDIERSRKMYDKRISAEITSRYDYFHHQLVAIVANGDPAKMGPNYPGAKLE